MAKHDRIRAKLINTPWLIEQEWLQTIVSIVDKGGDFEALRAKRDQHLDHTATASVRGDVAIVPLMGPIFPRANIMTEMSGATSLETFARDFQAAVDNDDISTIVIDVDSPGGAVTGISEMAHLIRNTEKKTVSFVRGAGASAAYWIATAADETVIASTALVGSIGVVTAYQKDDSDDGIIEFVNSASPKKRLSPSSKEGKTEIIKRLDDLAEVFISDIAMQRDVSESFVEENFGKGGVLVGQKAVTAGMADRIGVLEDLLTELNLEGDIHMDLKTLKADHKEVYDAAVKVGQDVAIDEGKEKVTALESQNATLKADVADKDVTIAANGETIKNFEKQDIVRTEQESARIQKESEAKADDIVSTQLSASDIPARLHEKIAAHIDHSSYIKEGALDEEGFTQAVNSEVESWAKDLGDSIQGFGSGGDEGNHDDNNNDNSESDAAVNRMLGHVNQKA